MNCQIVFVTSRCTCNTHVERTVVKQIIKLASLAVSVQGSVVHSRASSATKKYLAAFQHWKEWAQQYSLVVFPVKEAHLVLYMQNVAESTRSKATIEKSYNAMACIHAMGDCHSTTEFKFVQTVLQGLQRSLTKPVVKKLPVTAEMLVAIVEDTERSGSLADVWLATACVLSYTAFLGFDELVHIKAAEIKFNADFMSIHITRSKTDQH